MASMLLINTFGISIEIISLIIDILGLLDLKSIFNGGGKMEKKSMLKKVINGASEVIL